MNSTFDGEHGAVNILAARIDALERLLGSIQEMVDSNKVTLETMQDLNKEYTKQLNQLLAGIEQGVGGRLKVANPLTFLGSDNCANIKDWLNQIVLYCSATGNITNQQKIVCAPTCLHGGNEGALSCLLDSGYYIVHGALELRFLAGNVTPELDGGVLSEEGIP